jgi:hypothetical protein
VNIGVDHQPAGMDFEVLPQPLGGFDSGWNHRLGHKPPS